MRISDWSSDVCSSDLHRADCPWLRIFAPGAFVRHVQASCRGDTGALSATQARGGHEMRVSAPYLSRESRVASSCARITIQMASVCCALITPPQILHNAITGQLGRATFMERMCPVVQLTDVFVSLTKKSITRSCN